MLKKVVVISCMVITLSGFISLEQMMQTKPTRVIEHAVKGMLPHNRLGAKMIKKLKVYAGETQPHLTQAKTTRSSKVNK